ncbi:phage portal protein, partial [Escherichia coli]
IGVFDKLEERVVGKNGIIVEPHPVLRNGAIARDLAAEIRTRWSEWSVSPEVTGQFTRPMLERLMLRTWLRDGEVFAQMVSGRINSLTPSAGVIRLPRDLDRSSLYTAVYSGPVMPWIDPVKEAEAWKIQIRGGAATESDWVRAGGRNPDDVKRRRKAEIDENRKLDLVFDTDPASDKGGSSAATKRQ